MNPQWLNKPCNCMFPSNREFPAIQIGIRIRIHNSISIHAVGLPPPLDSVVNRWKMRRRAADYRRPVRRRFSYWIWLLLAFSSILALLLFLLQHNHHHQDPHRYPLPVTLSFSLLFSFPIATNSYHAHVYIYLTFT